MATKAFRLPDLGEGLEDAELVRWLVAVDEEVALNQPLVEVDTAKALVEIPSPVAGVVKQLHAEVAEVVKVGAVLVTFEVAEDTGEPRRKAVLVGYGVDEAPETKRRRRLRAPGANTEPEAPTVPSISDAPVQAPPPVRKLAADLGVDLADVKGSGPGGRITREDVMAASSSPGPREVVGDRPSLGAAEDRIEVKGVRRVVAEKMSRSASEIPHVTTYLSFDATEVMSLRAQLSARGAKVTPLAVISSAFARVCMKHRKLNSSWDGADHQIVLHPDVHMGIATDTERGLMVPVVRDITDLPIADVAAQVAELSALAREGRASLEQLTGSTVTVSNVGSFGAEYGTPIINHPEAAILAVGVIEDRVVVRSGGIVVRPMCTLSLSFDHRIMDGAEAGRALMDLKDLLEDGQALRAM